MWTSALETGDITNSKKGKGDFHSSPAIAGVAEVWGRVYTGTALLLLLASSPQFSSPRLSLITLEDRIKRAKIEA